METMKAARFAEIEKIEIAEVPKPVPKPDEVVAQIAFAGFCGTDLDLLNGRTAGGTAHYYVSDTPDDFAEQEMLFLGAYAGGPVDRIAIESY